MRFICTKISEPRHEILLREVLPELSTISIDFTLTTWRHWTWPACYWYGSQTVAHQSARVSRRKADTLNTKLASSFRPLLAGHKAICFSEWLQRLPAFIVDFRCFLCGLYLSSTVLHGFCS